MVQLDSTSSLPGDARVHVKKARLPQSKLDAPAWRVCATRLHGYADVYAGKLQPPDRGRTGPLMHLQLRVLEKTEFEKRLGKLERLMREGIMEDRKGRVAEQMAEKGLNRQTETIKTYSPIDSLSSTQIMASHACA